MAQFDVKKLDTFDRVLVGAAFVTFISIFLPWYGASVEGFTFTVSGWSTGYGWLAAVLIVLAGVYRVLQRSEVDLKKVPAGPSVVVLGLAALGELLVIIRWITLPSHSYLGGAVSYGPQVGIILAAIAGAVVVFCAVQQFRGSGEKLPWQKAA